MSLSSSIQPPINSLYPFVFAFPIPAVLTPLFLHEELVSTVKTTPSKHPPKNPPPTPPSVAAVLVLDVKIREGGFLIEQFLWWFSNKMWQRQGCGERVSGYLSVTFSETNEGRRVPTELWAQMAAVEKHSCTDHTVSTLGSRCMVW